MEICDKEPHNQAVKTGLAQRESRTRSLTFTSKISVTKGTTFTLDFRLLYARTHSDTVVIISIQPTPWSIIANELKIDRVFDQFRAGK